MPSGCIGNNRGFEECRHLKWVNTFTRAVKMPAVVIFRWNGRSRTAAGSNSVGFVYLNECTGNSGTALREMETKVAALQSPSSWEGIIHPSLFGRTIICCAAGWRMPLIVFDEGRDAVRQAAGSGALSLPGVSEQLFGFWLDVFSGGWCRSSHWLWEKASINLSTVKLISKWRDSKIYWLC